MITGCFDGNVTQFVPAVSIAVRLICAIFISFMYNRVPQPWNQNPDRAAETPAQFCFRSLYQRMCISCVSYGWSSGLLHVSALLVEVMRLMMAAWIDLLFSLVIKGVPLPPQRAHRVPVRQGWWCKRVTLSEPKSIKYLSPRVLMVSLFRARFGAFPVSC